VAGVIGIIVIALGIKIKWFRQSFNLHSDMVVENESPPRRYKPVQINESDALYGNFRKQSEFQQNEQQSGNATSATNVNEKISPTPSRSTLPMTNTSNEGHSTNDDKTKGNPSIQDVKYL
jgi:hypothetical protein